MIPVTYDDPDYQRQLDALPTDGVSIFTLENDAIRGALVSGTRLVAQMALSHRLGPLETLVLGQAYLAAGLLSVTIKGQDRLMLRVQSQGPSAGYSVECNAVGQVRGRLFNQPFELERPLEALDTALLLGSGFLSITRHQAGRSQPFTGTVALRSGRLAEDLAWYYHESEQTNTAFTLGLHFDRAGRVIGAGGLYLQALPFAAADALERVERLVYSLPQLGAAFAGGSGRADIMLRMFPFFDLNMLEERPLAFHCPCDKARLGGFLKALSTAERAQMREYGPFPVEVACHNCGSVYSFDQAELALLLA
ncbi:MAG: hypothetical protein A2087_09370 [Spirochaetes bacterium GWD1_61_31]|nr:MAG: hypothetical protein A2Y37_13915 [Spirochaetes bacterium GWB1_60_80]OHD28442.1 MAG: hypothetical protein A2004_08115 [Spirochaetes bacterium GWC1_61_12]OHD40292.1 MAG: hypothetical protein A2087_09370 [Spirochaetes bacterium GWD1_61_31]OHD44841.1 MAG: hypothetical protein A2Y35_00480 [Spirochaetes bacterium GWE1_60_18]OHD59955.1 MAG: hypothetical protein A2Y32_04735 [Spirochaetes bacterium GWF1_60_12]